MRTKILKSSKAVLSVVVAFTIIALSLFIAAPVANIKTDAATPTATDTWNGEKVKPETTDAEGNIIINNAEELAWVALEGGSATNGKNYKVADGQIFNMNGFAGVTLDSTVAEVKAATATGTLWRGNENIYFGGNFDGNGLIVYNLNSRFDGSDTGGHGGAGLFPFAQPYQNGAIQEFKNVKVAASAFKGYHGVGGIVGYANPGSTDRKWVFESVAVDSVYLYSHTHSQRVGGLVGNAGHTGITINNCLVSDIDIVGKTTGGLVASTSNFSPSHSFNNSIVLGYTPISNETGSKLASAAYSGVYTDFAVSGKAGVFSNDIEDMYEQACNKLDFSAYWLANAGVPELRAFHKLAATNNGDGTHSESCSRCGLAGLAAEHNFSIIIDEQTDGCACGITQKAPVRPTDTWNGDMTKPTATDAEGNVIINTAEELAWVALKGGAETNGVNYKVADGQVFDLAGFNGINLNSTLDDVKNAVATGKLWRGNENVYFGGNFDGNGLIVYNINSNKDGSSVGGHGGAGLFPFAQPYQAGETQSFSNVKVTLSAFKAYHGAGGIVGYANPGTTDRKWTFENIAVDSIYFFTHTHQQRVGGLVGNAGHTGITINNCLVANIEIVGKTTGGLVGSTSAYSPDHKFNNSVVSGISASSNETATKLASATYQNVYCDVDDAKATKVENWQTANLAGLDFATVWFANTTQHPVLKLFHKFTGTAEGKDGHIAECGGCGLVGANVEAHEFENGVCSICAYACLHENKDLGDVVVPGDCTTNKETAQKCLECGLDLENKVDTAPGHVLEKYQDYEAADCGNDGKKDAWYCARCQQYFLTDNANDTNPVTLEDIKIPATGNHTPLSDGNGIVWDMQLAGHHRKVCEVCQQAYGAEAHQGEMTADPLDPASGHSGTCTDCGYETTTGVTDPHEFGDDNVCDGCGWVCENHEWDDGVVSTPLDCLTDEVTDYTCEICDTVKQETTGTAIGHVLETVAEDPAKCNADGVKEHLYCENCDSKYALTATATTPFEEALSDADLAITEHPACTTEPVAIQDSNCTETGIEAHDKCPTCGKLYQNGVEVQIADITIPAKGHTYSELDRRGKPVWQSDDVEHWRVCTVCCGPDERVDVALHEEVFDTATYEGTWVHCEANCGYEVLEHKKVSDDGIVTVTADAGVFPVNVWTTIRDIVDEDAEYAEIAEILKKNGLNNFIIYNISPDEPMAEGGKANISMKVPYEFDENTAIYYIDVEGKKVTKLDTNVVADKEGNKTADADTNHFSVYALATKGINIDGDGDDYDDDYNNDYNYGYDDDSLHSPATSTQDVSACVVSIVLLIGAAFVIIRKTLKA